ncbi:MAG: queuosine precursor transporter [archaeon]|nr:queuosine precursor transporter [archaeon]MCP8314277.1 queuosine precursor transporter [archaeon]
MIVWLYWIISLTIVTYTSSYIVRKYENYGFAALTAFYTIYLGASQIIASRIINFDLGFYQFFAPAAVFIYPFVAQAIDMINEAYGKAKAHLAIFVAFITQVLLVTFIAMVNSLSPAPFFQFEEAWQNLFGLSIRITAASWIAFLICQNLDAHVFAFLKKKYEKRVVMRSLTSDVLDLTLDSVIFVTIAFYGLMPIIPLMIGQIISKNIIGFLDTPWFVWYKKMLTWKETSLIPKGLLQRLRAKLERYRLLTKG